MCSHLLFPQVKESSFGILAWEMARSSCDKISKGGLHHKNIQLRDLFTSITRETEQYLASKSPKHYLPDITVAKNSVTNIFSKLKGFTAVTCADIADGHSHEIEDEMLSQYVAYY